MKRLSTLAIAIVCGFPLLCGADEAKVIAVKQFSGVYPASHSLLIPFHGCVDMDRNLPEGAGEFWLSLDHIIADADFTKIEVLVNAQRTILGARARFKGTLDEWRGVRGYESRKRVLFAFDGGDGPELSKELPLAYDAADFGGMVYTFDVAGHVSWRKPQSDVPISEAEYVGRQERHKRECEKCKNLITSAGIVLQWKNQGEQDGTEQPVTRPESNSRVGDEPQPEPKRPSR